MPITKYVAIGIDGGNCRRRFDRTIDNDVICRISVVGVDLSVSMELSVTNQEGSKLSLVKTLFVRVSTSFKLLKNQKGRFHVVRLEMSFHLKDDGFPLQNKDEEVVSIFHVG